MWLARLFRRSRRNGHLPITVAADGKGMPIKSASMDLAAEGYSGWVAQVRTNLSGSRLRAIAALLKEGLSVEDAAAAFLALFPSWEGFVDDDGKTIPHTSEGLELLPDDLTTAMWARRSEVVQAAVMPGPLEIGSSEPPSESEKG